MNHTQAKKHKIIEDRNRTRLKWRKRGPRKDVRVGDIIESCNLHLGVVEKVDPASGNVDYISLMSGFEGSCDLYHCGVFVVPTKEVVEKLEVWRTEGKEGLRKLWDRKVLLS